MMLVDSVKTTHKDQLLRLADVFWINAEIDRFAVFDKIFGHDWGYDGKLVGEVDIAGSNLVDIDKIWPPLDCNEVHV